MSCVTLVAYLIANTGGGFLIGGSTLIAITRQILFLAYISF